MKSNYHQYHITINGAVYDTTTNELVIPASTKDPTADLAVRLNLDSGSPKLRAVYKMIAEVHIPNPNNYSEAWSTNPQSPTVENTRWVHPRARHRLVERRKQQGKTYTPESHKNSMACMAWKT